MAEDNACKLVIEIEAATESDILTFLDEIRSRVARLDKGCEAYAVVGHYRFTYTFRSRADRLVPGQVLVHD